MPYQPTPGKLPVKLMAGIIVGYLLWEFLMWLNAAAHPGVVTIITFALSFGLGKIAELTKNK